MLKTWWNRTFARKSGPTKRISRKRFLRFEPLEERALLTISTQSVPPTWQFEGPTQTDPPPAFNGIQSTAFGPGTVAYDSVSDIIVGGSTVVGVGAQTVPGQSTNWEKLPVPAGGPPPVGSPLGFPSGIVQVDTTSTPGTSIRYTDGFGFHSFTAQGFNAQNVPVAVPGQNLPTAAAQQLPLNMPGSTDATGNTGSLYTIDPLTGSNYLTANGGLGVAVPWALNTVDPSRLAIGTDYIYVSSDNGQNLTAVGGLQNFFNLNVGANVDIPDPATNIGPITALEYGGANPGGTANPDVLWVGSSGIRDLYLATTPGVMPAPVTTYPGAAPQAIVSNPTNWQQTFVIDNFNVYETINGGATWTTITGNLQSLGLSSIAFMHGINGDYLAVGVNNVVERTKLPAAYPGGVIPAGNWSQLGNALPAGPNPLAPFPIGTLQYNAAKDILIAGSDATAGPGNYGGAWELANATTAQPTTLITVDGNGTTDLVNFQIVGGNLQITDSNTPGNPPPHTLTPPIIPINTISGVIVKGLGPNSNVNLDFTNGNPVPNAPFTVFGNASTTIQANAVSNYVLSNSIVNNNFLKISTFNRTIKLVNVGNAQLTGAGNSFDVSGWKSTGTLIGLGANNTVISTNDSNFGLQGGPGITNGNLTVATGTNMVLNNIASALLTGGPGANAFNVTGWIGTGVITGNGGADSLTQSGNPDYTFSNTKLSSTTGTLLTLSVIPTLNLTAGANGAAFLDNGLTGGAAAFLTGQAGKTNTFTGNKDFNFTLSSTPTTITIGGSGTDTITDPADFVNANGIKIIGGATAHTIDVSGYTNAAITPSLTGAADTLTATIAANPVTYTLSNTALNVTTAGTANYSLGALAAVNLTGGAGTNTFNVNSWSRPGNFNGSTGNSTYNIGGAVGAGNLNNITGKLTLTSVGNGTNKLNVNDAAYTGGTNYQMATGLVSIATLSNRPTALGGVGLTYSAAINQVFVHGSTGADKYLVTPSATTQFTADNSAASAANGFLGVVFLGTTSHTATVAGNNGSWHLTTAANPQPLDVIWKNIAAGNMNGLGLIVLGGGTQPSNTSQPIIQVYDAETGQLSSQFLAYPSTFQLGIKVAVGGSLGGTTGPVIITAPGRGIAGTVNFYTKNTAPAGTVNATTPQGTLPAATIGSFQPYGAGYTNGINIAVGSVQANGLPDLIVAPQRGALPVQVYSLTNTGTPAAPHIVPTLKGSFLAYPSTYIGGVNVAGGNVLGHTGALAATTDVVTAPQSGMQATVEIWDGTTIKNGSTTATMFRSFLAMPATFRGGVSLAVGDVNGDGKVDIVTGAGSTGGSIVSVFNGVSIQNKAAPLGVVGTSTTVNGTLVPSFAAYTDPSNFAPVSVALKDVDGSGQLTIVTAQGVNGKSNLLRYWKVNPGGNPPVFQYPNTQVGAPPTPLGGLSIG